MDWEQALLFCVASERVSERQSLVGWRKKELSLSFPAPCSRVPLTRNFFYYPFNGELACRLEMLLFSFL